MVPNNRKPAGWCTTPMCLLWLCCLISATFGATGAAIAANDGIRIVSAAVGAVAGIITGLLTCLIGIYMAYTVMSLKGGR